MARLDAAADPRHALGTGIGRPHLQADVLLFLTEVHDASARLHMGPLASSSQRIVHAPHDDVARQQKRHREAKRRGREEVPIVCVHVVAVAFAQTEPIARMAHPGQQHNHRIGWQIRPLPDLAMHSKMASVSSAAPGICAKPAPHRSPLPGSRRALPKNAGAEGDHWPPPATLQMNLLRRLASGI